MAITVSADYWSAHVKLPTSKNGITENDRKATYQLVEKLGIAGKGCKRRYLSDLRFKTEAEAKKFWYSHTSAYGLLDKTLEISRGFDMMF